MACDYAVKHEGGESFLDMRRRFVPFVNELVQQSTGIVLNILCVGHGGLYWMMLPEVLANVGTEDIRQLGGFANTAVVVAEERDGQLVCIEWDGASYTQDSTTGS